MGGFFRIDGLFYRFGNIVYYLLVTNLLWVVFSLPLFTIGASTTALYYVMGRVLRDENVSGLKDFWKSFRLNFRQATVIWLILSAGFIILYINIRNINVMGSLAGYFLPLQIAVLLELLIIAIYIFPLLSRYELKTAELFKLSFFMGNRYILNTIGCILSLFSVLFLFLRFTGFFMMLFISLYAFVSYAIIYRVFRKIMPQEASVEEGTD